MSNEKVTPIDQRCRPLTYRKALRQRITLALPASALILTLGVAAAFYFRDLPYLLSALVVGAIFWIAFLPPAMVATCPNCRSDLGPLFQDFLLPRDASAVAFCPFCGVEFDDPIQIEATISQAEASIELQRRRNWTVHATYYNNLTED